MKRLNRLRTDERGVTLVELMVASIFTLIISGSVLGWVSTINTQEQVNRLDVAAIDELRVAKDRITKELRFASDVFPALSVTGETVVVWIDADKDGIAPEPGEWVTWAIDQVTGDLTRTRDTGERTIHGQGFDPTLSSITVNADGNVEIELVAKITDTPLRIRSIKTTVYVRSAS